MTQPAWVVLKLSDHSTVNSYATLEDAVAAQAAQQFATYIVYTPPFIS